MSKDVLMVSQEQSSLNEIRRKNLEILVLRYSSIASIARLTGGSPVYLGQVRHAAQDGDKKRVLGTNLARRMERELRLPVGWMDESHWDDAVNGPAPGVLDSLLSLAALMRARDESTDATDSVANTEYKQEISAEKAPSKNCKSIGQLIIELSAAIQAVPDAKRPLIYKLVQQIGAGGLDDASLAQIADSLAG